MLPQPASQDDLTTLLTGAFSTAWKRYFLPDRIGRISEEVARRSLAIHLVSMVKEGVSDEETLAAGGLLHLVSLEPEQTPRELLKGPAAKSKRGMPKPEVVSEPPPFVMERDLRRILAAAASRLVTAIGISAIVAFVFIALVVPKSQKTDAAELAVSKENDSSDPTVFDHPTLESVEPPKLPPDESQALLERLKEWQQRQ
jgi:hypothetical protein